MDQKIEKTAKALKTRGFAVTVCETAADAVAAALALVEQGSSITWGGSMTIRDIGLCDAVKAGDYHVFDRDLVPPAERGDFVREHFFSDWYFMSTNAVTETGELCNLDGTGNRVASLIFGPKNVLVIAGINKIVKDEAEAVTRVWTVAAPRNAGRFPINTPCKKTGVCADCLCPDTICCTLVRTRYCRPAGRVHVILVNEELGY